MLTYYLYSLISELKKLIIKRLFFKIVILTLQFFVNTKLFLPQCNLKSLKNCDNLINQNIYLVVKNF